LPGWGRKDVKHLGGEGTEPSGTKEHSSGWERKKNVGERPNIKKRSRKGKNVLGKSNRLTAGKGGDKDYPNRLIVTKRRKKSQLKLGNLEGRE